MGITVVKTLTCNFVLNEKVKLQMTYDAVLQRSNLLLLPGEPPLGFTVGSWKLCAGSKKKEKNKQTGKETGEKNDIVWDYFIFSFNFISWFSPTLCCSCC